MTARTPYCAPQLTELGSVKEMTQAFLGVISVAACVALDPILDAVQIALDGGCAAPAGS